MSVQKPPGVVAIVSVESTVGVDSVTGVDVSVGGIVAEVERLEQMPAVHPLLFSSFEALERR